GIAVRNGAYGASNSDRAVRAGHVFDDDWLAQRGAHRLTQDSRQSIDRTASPVWNDESHRTRWIWLSRRLASEQQRCKHRAQKCSIHIAPPQLHHPRDIMSDRLHVFSLAYRHAQIICDLGLVTPHRAWEQHSGRKQMIFWALSIRLPSPGPRSDPMPPAAFRISRTYRNPGRAEQGA